jgi:hypothetical protein
VHRNRRWTRHRQGLLPGLAERGATVVVAEIDGDAAERTASELRAADKRAVEVHCANEPFRGCLEEPVLYLAVVVQRREQCCLAKQLLDIRGAGAFCSVFTDAIPGRLKKLGAVTTPFASYVHYHGGNLRKWYGEERLRRMLAYRSFLDWGVPVAAASDFGCGPFEPLLGMQSC